MNNNNNYINNSNNMNNNIDFESKNNITTPVRVFKQYNSLLKLNLSN